MNTSTGISRRSVLAWTGILGISASLAAGAPRAEASPGESKQNGRGHTTSDNLSPNGWSLQDTVDAGAAIWTTPVQGTDISVALRLGAATTLFSHLIRRYHYEVDTLRVGDVIGFKQNPDTSRAYEINHQSGTAIDIRPGWYPAGVQGGYLAYQQIALESILDDFEGVISWGGHSTFRDESHFQLTPGPKDNNLVNVVRKIEKWNSSTGRGAGTAGSHRGHNS